jgi:hypothetical protein
MNGWSSNRPLEPADRQGSVQKNRSRSVGIWLVLPSHRPALDCLVGGCFLAAESLFPMRSGQRSVYHAIPTAFDSTFHCLHSESHTDSPRSRKKASRTPTSFASWAGTATLTGCRELFTVGWNRKPHAVLAGLAGSSRWVKLSRESLGERSTWAI